MSKKVCIVTDQSALSNVLRYALKTQGLETLEANSEPEVFKTIASHQVDMLIADLEFPMMDGLNLVRRLRRTEDYADLPVVVISCRDNFVARREALSLGVNFWLTKPFRLSELQTILEHSLGLAAPWPSQKLPPIETCLV